jgi:polyisoprenoid-binding protein YceI
MPKSTEKCRDVGNSMTTPAVGDLLRDGELAGSWTLDAGKSSVQLRTRHTWGLLQLVGAFTEFSGSGTIEKDGTMSGVFTVKAASVETRNPRRDKHLRSADFFDVANHPDFTYTVASVAPASEGVHVTGNLAIRETTREVDFDAKVTATGREVTLEAEIPVNRSDYGMTWNMLGIAPMQNTIVIHAVFARQR